MHKIEGLEQKIDEIVKPGIEKEIHEQWKLDTHENRKFEVNLG